jgi:predicted ATPase/DNA-binding SARP family transcriptional activator
MTQPPTHEANAPSRVSASVPHNVPAALSSFVGRERGREELTAALGTERLVTVTGAGGSGKTRLAREVAARAVARALHPGGVWWVELAPVADGAEVPGAVAAALGVRALPTRPLVAGLADALRGSPEHLRRTLLVLDNCEHVVDEVAALVERLLGAVPGLTILATSREALGVEGEVVWATPPLACPPTSGRGSTLDVGAAALNAATVGEFEAARLFVERARDVDPRFTFSDDTAPRVAALCARLDGLPLALELAAAALPTFGLDGLAARLDDALAVLTRGRRTAAARHRTLRAVLDWSYTLLAPDEQSLLRRLSVFRDTFTLDAVLAVCAPADEDAPGAPPTDEGALAAFARLVGLSLVVLVEENGEARYRLLETVRQYGAALLDGTPDEAPTRSRHARWVADVVERDEPETTSPARGAVIARQLRALDDVRAALGWATGTGDDAVVALRIVGGLAMFWAGMGSWAEGRRWVATAIAAADRAAVDDLRRPVAERTALARTLHAGLAIDWLVGDGALAETRVARALPLWASLVDDPAADARTRRDATRWRALTLERAALSAAVHRRDRTGAERLMADALEAARASGSAWVEAWVFVRRASLRLLGDDPALVAADAAEGEQRLRRLGDRWARSLAFELLAEAARRQGRLGAAADAARTAIALLRPEPDLWFVSRQIEGLGAVAATATPAAPLTTERARTAARLLAVADGLRTRTGTALNPLDRPKQEAAVAAVRAALGPAFDAAWTEGAALPSDAVFALAADAEVLPSGYRDPVTDAVRSPTVPAAAPTPGLLPPAHRLTLRLLGPLAIERDGVPLPPDALPPRRGRALLLALALHPDGRTREQLGVLLWPDGSDAQVRNNLHITLHHLRRALGDHAWVTYADGRYRLARGGASAHRVEVDVDRLIAASAAACAAEHRGERPAHEALEAWAHALAAFDRGALGADTGSGDWLAPHAARIQSAWADGTSALAALWAGRGDHARAAALLEALVAREPMRESAHRALLRAYVARGEHARARAHYDAFAALVARTLGTRPADETTAVANAAQVGV